MKNIKTYQQHSLRTNESEEGLLDHDAAMRRARMAIVSGSERTLKEILDSRMDPDSAKASLGAMLSLAVDHGSTGICRYLISRGAKPTNEDLMRAMLSTGSKNVMGRLLLENMPDLHGMETQLLGFAAATDSPELVKALLERGAKTDAHAFMEPEGSKNRLRNGLRIPGHACTALAMAAANGSHRSAAILLRRGSDPNDSLSDHKTPTDYAIVELRAMLNAANFYDTDHLKRRIENARKTVMLLVKAGGNPLKEAKADELLGMFNGDIDWMPEGDLKEKLKRMQRGKSAFGM